MLEKFALLKIALCRAPVVSRASECPAPIMEPDAPGVRRSEGLFAVVISLSSSSCRFGASGHRLCEIKFCVRPDAEGLERVLRDETAVLADDHDSRDSRSFCCGSFHRRLNFDPRVFADSPLTVPAARTASRAALL